MMEKGFLGKPRSIWLALLATVAGVSGVASAAEVRGVRIAASETGTRIVLDLSAPVSPKTFLLDDPRRVVVDVPRSSLKAALPEGAGLVTAVRSGRLPHSGLRLVFDVSGPVSFQSAAVAPAGDAGHR